MATINGRSRLVAPNYSIERIATLLAGQLNAPVMDSTGAQGKYDVTLQWVGDAAIRRSVIVGPESGQSVDWESGSGPTLLQALQDQLGLKLQAKKVTVDVAVIDSVEELPTEN